MTVDTFLFTVLLYNIKEVFNTYKAARIAPDPDKTRTFPLATKNKTKKNRANLFKFAMLKISDTSGKCAITEMT